MKPLSTVGACGLAILAAGPVQAGSDQPQGAVVYWMSAHTQAGMTPGARPSIADMMTRMRGGPVANHLLTLDLGSPFDPDGPPKADHLPPTGLGVGASLPLLTPASGGRVREDSAYNDGPRAKGRLMIFWGCGEHAAVGQPVVIDLSRPNVSMAAAGSLDLHVQRPPSTANARTYGGWPNARATRPIPAGASLAGEHVVRANYAPEIRFTLGKDQDFLQPLILIANEKTTAGSVRVAWKTVPNARAFFANVVGGDGGAAVMWSSSALPIGAAMLNDYLPPGEIKRLVDRKVLLGADQTQCVVPQEVIKAAPQAMLNLTAFGGEANFSWPKRPADAKADWRPDWVAKVRYKSTTTGLLGMPDPMGRLGADETDEDEAGDRPRPSHGKALKSLGGFSPF